MEYTKISKIVKEFFPGKSTDQIRPYGNGHIHQTYIVSLKGDEKQFILQLINKEVFSTPSILIKNHLKLSEKFELDFEKPYQIPALFSDSKNNYLVYDDQGNPWRMMEYIPASYSIDVLEENAQAFEGGKAYGWFSSFCKDLDVSDFKEAIPKFHNLKWRLEQFSQALDGDIAGRKDQVSTLIDFYLSRAPELENIQSMVDSGEIPTRVSHNDTKINNILFRGASAVAVIDLDTVGPGILFYDYGDSLRTMANFAAEDEKDLSKTGFNLQAFEAFSEGYLSFTAGVLNQKEKDMLYLAPKLMTFIMGIRFLTDYLNGDTYYKIAYANHNLIRSQVQEKLIRSMEHHKQEIKKILAQYY